MATHLTLLCHGATRAMRIGAFACASDSLDQGGRTKLAQFRLQGPRPDRLLTSEALAARQTADHFGLTPEIEVAIGDIGVGTWAGYSLAGLLASDPALFGAWLANPAKGTPDGEPMQAVAERVQLWLERMSTVDARIVAVTHAAVLRAVVAVVLAAPLPSVLNIDVAPLTAVTLSFNRTWRLQGIGNPAVLG